jgi:hypothetical protein
MEYYFNDGANNFGWIINRNITTYNSLSLLTSEHVVCNFLLSIYYRILTYTSTLQSDKILGKQTNLRYFTAHSDLVWKV